MTAHEYRRKRNFDKTPEPRGRSQKSQESIFVIQEHHASHLHYDFRLEAFGTLKSWAVPKGPPLEVGEKRLAVQVEDHPLAYASFKGRIPKGQYGAGTVKIWDHGTWKSIKPLRESFKRGQIEIELSGKKLKGRWILIRSDRLSGKNPQWLLIKGHDKAPVKNEIKEIRPQLATLSESPPQGKEWIHEIKLDGYRTLAVIQDKKSKLLTRSSLDWTKKYLTIAAELNKLPVKNAVIDGEIVVRDSEGRTSFTELTEALSRDDQRNLEYFVFDLLYLNGRDLRSEPLIQRKEILKKLLKYYKGSQLHFNEHFSDHIKVSEQKSSHKNRGAELFKKACELGLEGIISKDGTKPYQMNRSKDWVKVKCVQRQEFVIGGFSSPQNSRLGFGALLLGVYEQGKLRYVGRVGTGFSDKALNEIFKSLKGLEIQKSPFQLKSPEEKKNIHWVRPQLVAEVEFRAWTGSGVLRHSSFVSLREDKPAQQINPENITHPDRVLFKKDKFKKIDVASYYHRVAPFIIPLVSGRPLALLRCVDSTSSGCFYQKHLGTTKAPHVKESAIRKQEYMYIDSEKGLLELVQAGAIEFHVWQSHQSKANSPNQIVFDLDPDESLPWSKIVAAAFRLKEVLEGLKLQSFVKTTGGKGLHIHVPIATGYDFETIKEFSKTICQYLAQKEPELYVVSMAKSHRKNKIFLDYLRNGFGATAIAPFSMRAKDHPYVSVPLSWPELQRMKKQKNFLPSDVLRRLSGLKQDPWVGYSKLKQKIKILKGVSLGSDDVKAL